MRARLLAGALVAAGQADAQTDETFRDVAEIYYAMNAQYFLLEIEHVGFMPSAPYEDQAACLMAVSQVASFRLAAEAHLGGVAGENLDTVLDLVRLTDLASEACSRELTEIERDWARYFVRDVAAMPGVGGMPLDERLDAWIDEVVEASEIVVPESLAGE